MVCSYPVFLTHITQSADNKMAVASVHSGDERWSRTKIVSAIKTIMHQGMLVCVCWQDVTGWSFALFALPKFFFPRPVNFISQHAGVHLLWPSVHTFSPHIPAQYVDCLRKKHKSHKTDVYSTWNKTLRTCYKTFGSLSGWFTSLILCH